MTSTSFPAPADDLLAHRLTALGLRGVAAVRTHVNRTVMVSLTARRVLRVHRGYAFAPDRVLAAIVGFLDARRPRAERRDAERVFLAFPVEQYVPRSARARPSEPPRPGDLTLLHRLHEVHCRFNVEYFGDALGEIPIRLSGRMRVRLGEVSVDLRTGRPIEIAISRLHVARHPWDEVEHTILHEMVHQWQAESGLSVDHGPTFRTKAREVGVLPAARRPVAAGGQA
ncbi:MAG: SprT-like domain-containing protein, partial [Gemmatimonadales bacterium]